MTGIRSLDAARHASSCFDRNAVAATQRLVQIGLSEIALAVADMPLCLAKDATTGRFNLVALMGLIEPANLFSIDGRLHATYMPSAATVSCFRLDANGAAGLAIDESDNAIGSSGQPLIEHGDPAAFLMDVHDLLNQTVDDVAAAQQLVNHLALRRLVSPLRLNLQVDDKREEVIDGLYSINAEALRNLPDEDIIELHRVNALTAAGTLMTSLTQFERLRQLHNQRYRNKILSLTVVTASNS